MDLKLYEAVFLTRIESTGYSSIINKFPSDSQINFDVDVFLGNGHPTHEYKLKEGTFCFTIQGNYFFTAFYTYEEFYYDIVIQTKLPLAFIYETFFEELLSEFSKDSSLMQPEVRFAFVTSLISTWNNVFQPYTNLTFPMGLKEVNLSTDHLCYMQYQPHEYFTLDECNEIHYALLEGEPILFQSLDPVNGCHAVYAALSLIAPLQYNDSLALWLLESDSRINNISCGMSDLKVVLSPEKNLAQAQYFKHIFNVRKRDLYADIDVRNGYIKRVHYLTMCTSIELDTLIDEDPWSDVLEAPLNIDRLFKQAAMLNMAIDANLTSKFCNTETFKMWRRRFMWRDDWTNAIKSRNPKDVWKNKTREEKEKILECINRIPSDLKADPHLWAVLKTYRKIAASE